MSLEGKVVFITGGTKGIGKSAALLFVKKGAKVAVNYASDSASAGKTVEELGGEGKALAVQGDAGSVKSIEKMVETVVAKFGKIDILVPNAGALLMRDLESTSEADFDKLYNINVKGPYFLAQKAVPHMPEGGRIILISTNQAHASIVTAPYLLYTSTKGAVEQMVRIMSKDLARKKINVNGVAPGPTGTDLFYEGKSEQLLKTIASFSPFNRIAEPEEVAQAIVWLGSPESSWITGQTIKANGGIC